MHPFALRLACCVAAFGLVPASGRGESAPAAADPGSVSPMLYRELEGALTQATRAHPLQARAARPLMAPALMMAGSGLGPAAADSARWRDLLLTADAFRDLGMNAVSVMIAAPDLSLGDPRPTLDFYRRLRDELHARGLKLYVEHFDNPPFSPHAHQGWVNDAAGRRAFLRMRAAELALIHREIAPDYLSLVTEPSTMSRWSKLSFSTPELAAWVREVAAQLKSQGGPTQLGAGAPTWEPEEFALQVSRFREIDYVDVHFYSLNLDGVDQVDRLVAVARKLRAIRPALRLTIGETWLYKHGAAEPRGMLNRDAYFRDNFDFWQPLDAEFLRLVVALAQEENVEVVAPYFSEHFFTYFRFGSADALQLPPWPACLGPAWEKAHHAMHARQFSPTGEAMRTLLTTSP